MSDESLASLDPFTSVPPDEETELRALVRALDFVEGFSLLLVRCNLTTLRQRLVAELRKQLPQLTIQEIHFNEPIGHLLDELRWRISTPPPRAIFVSGLEYSLPIAAYAHATPFVANLNAARNSFSRVVPGALVLWVPEYVLTAIMRGAPDFFSVRSGVYFFDATADDVVTLLLPFLVGEKLRVTNLTLNEKQERIAAIESLLADYQRFPSVQRDRVAEARLSARLGDLYLSLGDLEKAKRSYQQSAVLFEELGDRFGIAGSSHQLGIVAERQGAYDEALEWYHKSLAIEEELGNREGMVASYLNLGMVAYERKAYDEALEWSYKALATAEEVGDRAGMAASYHQLGMVAQRRGAYDEALEWYHKSLATAEEVGDQAGMAVLYHNLGTVAQDRGAYDEALAWYRKALAIEEELGDRVRLASSSSQIGVLLTERGTPDQGAPFNLRSLLIRAELRVPEVRYDLHWLTRQRELLGGQRFLAILREQVDEETAQTVLGLLAKPD